MVFIIYGHGGHLVNNLGQRARNDLDLEYHIPSFFQLVVCIYQLQLTGYNCFLKITVFIFSYTKTYVTKFDLALNKSTGSGEEDL